MVGVYEEDVTQARRSLPASSLLHEDTANRNREVSERDFDDWSTVPEAWIENAATRLNAVERENLLRHKLLAYCWMPTCTVYGALHEGAVQRAQEQDLNVLGRFAPSTYGNIIRRVFAADLLRNAVHGLAYEKPWASAHRRFSNGQAMVFLGVGLTLLALAAFSPWQQIWTGVAIAASLFFLMVVTLRCFCLMPLPKGQGIVAPLLPDADLPVYSVLVPLFRETAVVQQLIGALSMLNYPSEKLDIKIILEESDLPMRHAVEDLALPWYFDVIIVPKGPIQTKPRALNYAMQFARGTLITIYDSEDIPQPQQLQLAAAQFASAAREVACLQASLDFYNPAENWLTRHFTAEYSALFRVILPGLASYGLPLPLGGTSNHFRASALEEIGGWDAFNVTEDADLGIRLARHGYLSDILHSTTYEEATTELGNWMKQRRRWLKGFLQTWLVHNRQPLQLLEDVGFSGFCVVQAMTLGVFASALLHPVLLMITLWNMSPGQIEQQMATPLGAALTGLSLAILLAGYVSAIGTHEKGLRKIGVTGWASILWTIPLYWMLISMAAWAALWDLIVAPYHWHKTKHGRSRFMRQNGRAIEGLLLTRHQNNRRAENDNEDHGQEEQDHRHRQLRR